MATQNKSVDPNLILTLAGVGAGGFLFYKLLQKVGLIDSKEDTENTQANNEVEESKFVSPTYWQTAKAPVGYAIALIKNAEADNLAKQIEESYGYFNDDEDKVYGAVKRLKYKTQFSYLAYRFNLLYGKDLFLFLKGFLSSEELATISKFLKALPTFVKK